jgi:hypothetical protein
MNVKMLRRLLFLTFWFMLPWPMIVFNEAFVPAARYALLASAAAAVAMTEGTAGTVPALVELLVGWTVVTTLASWCIAWLVSRWLGSFAPRWRVAFLLGLLLIGLTVGLTATPYATPFGRAERGGLLEVLS